MSVFLSHSSKDKLLARGLADTLERVGTDCWYAPRNIGPSDNYGAAIVKAIRVCKLFVILLTKNANLATGVASETEIAFSEKKSILVVKLEDVALSDELAFFVRTVQHVDLASVPKRRRVAETADAVKRVMNEKPASVSRKKSPSNSRVVEKAKSTPTATMVQPVIAVYEFYREMRLNVFYYEALLLRCTQKKDDKAAEIQQSHLQHYSSFFAKVDHLLEEIKTLQRYDNAMMKKYLKLKRDVEKVATMPNPIPIDHGLIKKCWKMVNVYHPMERCPSVG